MTDRPPPGDPGPGGARPRRPHHRASLLVPGAVCAFLLFTSLHQAWPGLSVFNGKRWLEILLLTALPALALAWAPLRRETTRIVHAVPPPLGLALAAILVLAAGSSLRMPGATYGLSELSLLPLTAVAALIVAASCRLGGRRFDRLALAAIAALALLVGLRECMGVLANWSMASEFGFREMLITFAHPRFYNQVQSWTLPALAAIPLVFGNRPTTRVLAVCALGMGWCVLLMSGARGSAISITAGLLVVALVCPWRQTRRWLGTHLSGLALGALLIGAIAAGNAHFAPSGGSFVEDSVGRPLFHTTGRSTLWRLAWSKSLAQPWLGVGTGNYNCGDEPVVAAHPHSFPLQILAEWGWPATMLTAAVALWLAATLVQSLRRAARSGDEVAAHYPLLAAGVVAAAVHAGVSGVLLMPASQVAAALIGGWLIGVAPRAEAPARIRQETARRGAHLLLAAALVVGIAVTGEALRQLSAYERLTAPLAALDAPRPRFWSYGQSCRYSD